MARIMIAAGGTGGHVYPALAVAEAMTAEHPDTTLTFVGGIGSFERPLVDASGKQFASYAEVRSGPLHGVKFWQIPVSVAQVTIGTAQALRLMRRHKPDALLLTGGWVGLPVALAAWLLRVPALIYLPDIEPGLAIKVLRRFARRVAVTADESLQFFKSGQAVVTGYPVRADVANASRADAINYFKLDPQCKTLLVFGGSRGARNINNALLANLPELLERGVQVIHVTGTLDWPEIEARLDEFKAGGRYHAYPYLHGEMGLAFAAADLVVCRAGASVLGELPLFGLPSILVPYPYAWRYQKVNADYLANRGAAIRMDDEQMTDALLPSIMNLLDNPAQLEQMRSSAAALAQPDGAAQIARELLQLAGA